MTLPFEPPLLQVDPTTWALPTEEDGETIDPAGMVILPYSEWVRVMINRVRWISYAEALRKLLEIH